jgi:hypothetical protein
MNDWGGNMTLLAALAVGAPELLARSRAIADVSRRLIASRIWRRRSGARMRCAVTRNPSVAKLNLVACGRPDNEPISGLSVAHRDLQ